MNIVFLSHTPYPSSFRVGSHHLSDGMAALGHSVVRFSTPITPAHSVRAFRDQDIRTRFSESRRPYRADSGVLHAVPITPLPLGLPGRLGAANDRRCGRHLARFLRAGGHEHVDVLLIDQPTFWPAAKQIPATVRVYRGTDVYFGKRQREAVQILARQADAIVATSETVLESITKRAAEMPTLVLPNGVEFDHFNVPARANRAGGVYVGALDHRFDWNAVIALANAIPAMPIKLAGPLSVPRPELPPNVEVLGPVPYESVPALLSSARVGLLPLSSTAANQGRSPMKLYEYLAAGLSVVGSRTETLSCINAPGVFLYDSVSEAADMYGSAVRLVSVNEPGRTLASKRDWSANTRLLLTFVEQLSGATTP
jgi:teichuronic acid biosynthesis glycosyltransferase TuaH